MIQSISNYIKGSLDELKKVDWPTREETIKYSIIVIASALIAVALLTVIDYGLNDLVNVLVI